MDIDAPSDASEVLRKWAKIELSGIRYFSRKVLEVLSVIIEKGK